MITMRHLSSSSSGALNCLIAKGPTVHLLADFFIMTSQSNGPSNSCAIVTSQWNDVKKPHGKPHVLNLAKGQLSDSHIVSGCWLFQEQLEVCIGCIMNHWYIFCDVCKSTRDKNNIFFTYLVTYLQCMPCFTLEMVECRTAILALGD